MAIHVSGQKFNAALDRAATLDQEAPRAAIYRNTAAVVRLTLRGQRVVAGTGAAVGRRLEQWRGKLGLAGI
jgi:hypothetical protein